MHRLKAVIYLAALAALVLWATQTAGNEPGALPALVFVGALQLRALQLRAQWWPDRFGSPVHRAARERASARPLVFAFFLSLILALAAPLAAEAMPSIESSEEMLHTRSAHARARREVVASRRVYPVRAASVQPARPATPERSRRPAAGSRVRKVPPLIPDSSAASPDH